MRYSESFSDGGIPQAGALLAATPHISEGIFFRSIILLLEYSPAGAVGVILNDMATAPIDDVLPRWEGILDSHVGIGGPVQQDSGIAIAQTRMADVEDEHEPDGADIYTAGGLRYVSGLWAVLDLDQEPTGLTADVEYSRLFLGYAGWERAQLDEEIVSGSWWTLPSQAGDLMLGHEERSQAWRRVMARQPNELRLAGTFPDQPEHN